MFMATYTVLFCYTKGSKSVSYSHIFWYLKEGVDLNIRHDENNVLTDDELVIVTNFIKK